MIHEELQLLGEQPQLRSFFRDSWERVLGERMSTTVQTRDHEELEPGRGRDTFPSQFTDYNGGRPLNVQKCVKEGERNVALD